MAPERVDHELCLQGRSSLTVSGVTEVVSFTDSEVVLNTNMGVLGVHGQQLQLKMLSLEGGRTEVAGTITALIYEESRSGGSWLSRLLG